METESSVRGDQYTIQFPNLPVGSLQQDLALQLLRGGEPVPTLGLHQVLQHQNIAHHLVHEWGEERGRGRRGQREREGGGKEGGREREREGGRRGQNNLSLQLPCHIETEIKARYQHRGDIAVHGTGSAQIPKAQPLTEIPL